VHVQRRYPVGLRKFSCAVLACYFVADVKTASDNFSLP